MNIPTTYRSKLIYLPDSSPGYTRRAKGKGFAYYNPAGQLVKNRTQIDRFKRLVIPPAWTAVWISPKANGHVQATGYDDRHRKQYIYHPAWNQMQTENKYNRMLNFAKALPRLRKQRKSDIRKRKYSKEKVVAIALELMEETLIRAGNAYYRDHNSSYGLSTLNNRHVRIDGRKIFFRFQGKKGVLHKISCSDRVLAKHLKGVMEIPGQQLFQYYDAGENICTLDSGDLNAYIQACTGADFTSKDFRTWYGTVWAFRILSTFDPFRSQQECERNIIQALDFVAQKLGNTRSVCKKYYVSAWLLRGYENRTLFPYFKKARRGSGKANEQQKAEKQLMAYLEAAHLHDNI